jgi:hypothetical protein
VVPGVGQMWAEVLGFYKQLDNLEQVTSHSGLQCPFLK